MYTFSSFSGDVPEFKVSVMSDRMHGDIDKEADIQDE
jgi:hypothetical protein